MGTIKTTTPFEFSAVCQELYGSSNTVNKTLIGAHAAASGTFNSTYNTFGTSKTLLDFRGYMSPASAPITLVQYANAIDWKILNIINFPSPTQTITVEYKLISTSFQTSGNTRVAFGSGSPQLFYPNDTTTDTKVIQDIYANSLYLLYYNVGDTCVVRCKITYLSVDTIPVVDYINITLGVMESPPAAPTLTLGTVTSTSLAFTWNAPATADSYVLWWRVSGGSWSPVGLSGTSYTLSGLSASTTYEVYVIASNAIGDSPVSNTITQETLASQTDTTPPSTPIGLAGIGFGSYVSLYWEASTDNVGVTGYNIYRDGGLLDTSATNTYDDVYVTTNTTYIYKVQAFDAANNLSGFSAEQTINSGNIA